MEEEAGEAVVADEILVEIETDKVVLEVPSPSAGVLSELVVADGGTVVSNQLIAKVDSEASAGAVAAPAAAPAAALAARLRLRRCACRRCGNRWQQI